MIHSPEQVQSFFADSNGLLDYLVLRPLSHITTNWELTWDGEAYREENNSFATLLNRRINDLALTTPPDRYHDNEDRLGEYVVEHLNWRITKQGSRWIGADYQSILEQGGFHDVDQSELLRAAAGRVHAALTRGQAHFDDMEKSHRHMLAAVLTIILYHRENEVGYKLVQG